MIYLGIGFIFLAIAWIRDRSGMREFFLKYMGCQKSLLKLEKIHIEDRKVELFKTICYVLLAAYWIFIRNASYIIPAIILAQSQILWDNGFRT